MREFGVVAGGFAGAETLDGGADLVRPQPQFLHQPPRRIDFRLRHAAVGFGDMAHELEGRAEKSPRSRSACGRARRRRHGRSRRRS